MTSSVEMVEVNVLLLACVSRSVNLVYQKNVAVKGLDLYRFIVDPLTMASNETNEENNAYCTPPGNCLGDGVLNVSSCMQGAPIILSLPHLNQAAQEYQDAIEGLRPEPELDTVLDVHPVSNQLLFLNV